MAQVESDDQGQAVQGIVIQAALGGQSQRCSACGLRLGKPKPSGRIATGRQGQTEAGHSRNSFTERNAQADAQRSGSSAGKHGRTEPASRRSVPALSTLYTPNEIRHESSSLRFQHHRRFRQLGAAPRFRDGSRRSDAAPSSRRAVPQRIRGWADRSDDAGPLNLIPTRRAIPATTARGVLTHGTENCSIL